ncbi:Ger(x)C family spore germination protein [Lederbergia lenta]|uniref:Ger(x)C family spore germination protein n=1 Tax=Lederbergia lenta TaxID=1467 RepID=UPI00203A40E0|nr:Ger(x)C family spore germination protein [Lederbergia lenta]MCM3112572.1 Ger(x)C family spore germination protein [Lederbergia lenta]
MSHRFLCFFSIIGTMLLLSGCWSQKELTELAIITSLGIDKNEKGEYVGSFQIIIPSNVGGMMGSGNGEGTPFIVHTATGNNLVEVSDNLSKKISRKQYFSHTGLVVIGEELATEEGIMPIFDILDRDTDFRTSASIVIAENTSAENIIKTLTPIDRISAENVLKTMQYTQQRTGQNIDVKVNDLIRGFISSSRVPVISSMRLIGDEERIGKMESLQDTLPDVVIEASGLAVIYDGKLVDLLHGDKSRGAVWIMDKIKDTSIFIDWKEKKDAVTFHVIRQKTNISAHIKNKTPSISVHVEAEGNIDGLLVPVNLNDLDEIHRVERKLEEEIKKQLENTIQHMQELKADIFGFGEAVHRSHPKAWRELEKRWNEDHFPEMKVNVRVDAYVRRSGLRNKSFLNEVEINKDRIEKGDMGGEGEN